MKSSAEMALRSLHSNDNSGEENLIETFPGIDRREIYKKVYRSELIHRDRGNGRYVDNSEEIKSLESELEKGKIDIEKLVKNENALEEEDYAIRKLDLLTLGESTSNETLVKIFNKITEKVDVDWKNIAKTRWAKPLVRQIVLNPNLDPKVMEDHLDGIYENLTQPGIGDDGGKLKLFLSRPDLTPETIRKLVKKSGNFFGSNNIAILLHNPNMPTDLKKELLTKSDCQKTLKQLRSGGSLKKDLLNFDEERVKLTEKYYQDNKK